MIWQRLVGVLRVNMTAALQTRRILPFARLCSYDSLRSSAFAGWLDPPWFLDTLTNLGASR